LFFSPAISSSVTNIPWSQCLLANRWIVVAFICLFGLHLGAVPVLAQGDSNSQQTNRKQKKKIMKVFKKGKKLAQSGDYAQASGHLEKALNLAQEIEWKQATQLSEKYLVSSLTQAGTAANKKKDYKQALSHYEKVMQYVDDDPTVHYNRGLALLGVDSTEAGLQSLQKSIKIGNKTGNTRVAGLATERIRDEFLAKASKALQGENPSQEQVNTALDALDRMREYVEPNANALFYRATALSANGQPQQAIQEAREGLEMHQGSRSDAAKFYYVIGEAQMETGNKATACETFKNATYGDYEARANHYLQNECDDL
jgi:tetratricopeptide (TPR) repeat protein